MEAADVNIVKGRKSSGASKERKVSLHDAAHDIISLSSRSQVTRESKKSKESVSTEEPLEECGDVLTNYCAQKWQRCITLKANILKIKNTNDDALTPYKMDPAEAVRHEISKFWGDKVNESSATSAIKACRILQIAVRHWADLAKLRKSDGNKYRLHNLVEKAEAVQNLLLRIFAVKEVLEREEINSNKNEIFSKFCMTLMKGMAVRMYSKKHGTAAHRTIKFDSDCKSIVYSASKWDRDRKFDIKKIYRVRRLLSNNIYSKATPRHKNWCFHIHILEGGLNEDTGECGKIIDIEALNQTDFKLLLHGFQRLSVLAASMSPFYVDKLGVPSRAVASIIRSVLDDDVIKFTEKEKNKFKVSRSEADFMRFRNAVSSLNKEYSIWDNHLKNEEISYRKALLSRKTPYNVTSEEDDEYYLSSTRRHELIASKAKNKLKQIKNYKKEISNWNINADDLQTDSSISDIPLSEGPDIFKDNQDNSSSSSDHFFQYKRSLDDLDDNSSLPTLSDLEDGIIPLNEQRKGTKTTSSLKSGANIDTKNLRFNISEKEKNLTVDNLLRVNYESQLQRFVEVPPAADGGQNFDANIGPTLFMKYSTKSNGQIWENNSSSHESNDSKGAPLTLAQDSCSNSYYTSSNSTDENNAKIAHKIRKALIEKSNKIKIEDKKLKEIEDKVDEDMAKNGTAHDEIKYVEKMNKKEYEKSHVMLGQKHYRKLDGSIDKLESDGLVVIPMREGKIHMDSVIPIDLDYFSHNQQENEIKTKVCYTTQGNRDSSSSGDDDSDFSYCEGSGDEDDDTV